jgi:hypothetical protein
MIEYKGLEVYDSPAYKLMCVMDIMMDINPDYRDHWNCSEDMFNDLVKLLVAHEELDDGGGSWYDNLGTFLSEEYNNA